MSLPPFSLDNPDTLFFWQYSGKSTVMSHTVISPYDIAVLVTENWVVTEWLL